MRFTLFLFLSAATLSAQTIDTMFYGNTKTLHPNPYGNAPRGYIAGTNNYGDVGKYQRFDVIDEVTVVGARFWMALKRVVDTPDTIAIVFTKAGYGEAYYDSVAGGPGGRYRSITATLADFDTTGGSTFMLAQPFNVAGGAFTPESVFVGIEWSSAANDTFALYCDADDQGEKQFRAWEQLTGVDYTYQRFDEPSDFSWGLDSDLWIALLYKKGLMTVRSASERTPEGYTLHQNHPNPFNPSTTVTFDVPAAGHVSLTVFDILGKEVATLVNGRLDAGSYSAVFTAPSLTSGLYFYRMTSGGFTQTRKMMFVK